MNKKFLLLSALLPTTALCLCAAVACQQSPDGGDGGANESYLVTYDATGGTMMGGQSTYMETVQGGSVFNLTITPIKYGYDFDGWYNPQGQKVTQIYNQNAVLTARWSATALPIFLHR